MVGRIPPRHLLPRGFLTRGFLPLLLLPVLLGGCGFFTASLFPGYLAQAEMVVDLNDSIDEFLSGQDYYWHANLFVLRSASGEDYCAVLIELENLPQKKLILVDPSGDLQERSDPGLGRLHLTDLNGDFVVGSLSFPPSALSGATYRGIDNHNLGFADGSYNYQLWCDGGAASNQLSWQNYDSAWASVSGTYYANIREAQSGFELRNLYYDSEASDAEVILVFYNYMSGWSSVYFLPAAGFGGTLPVSPDSLMELYPPLILDPENDENVCYTRKGIVVADWNGRAELQDFDGADTGKSLDGGQLGEVRLAFDLEGENFYAFAADARVLYRGRTGW
jgi:hypothetical protein